ncbi:hypothetical protein DL764_006246 [Monosporascus ibericus]|uniref:Uncharacterized protein n=1 Tax=Monosporascus ibericus TaxID=155417 RepID=A0A4Q4T586_9PEZI|nr:hypothetical protein DL764_006246 [Monosporascus ibericus]
MGTTIAVYKMAGSSGDIRNQQPVLSGWQRSWLVVSTLTAQRTNWLIVWTHISELSRCVKNPRGAYYQTVFFPFVVAQLQERFAQYHSAHKGFANLLSKYVNIRRAAMLYAIVGGWVTVPRKIVTSATSLLNLMTSLGIFVAPVIAISIGDYWVVKQICVQVSALYGPQGRCYYTAECNWTAAMAMLVRIGPTMPRLAKDVIDPLILLRGDSP